MTLKSGSRGVNELDTTEESRRGCIYCPERFEPLLIALGQRDGYTGIHSKSVESLVKILAKTIGLTEEEIRDIALAASLHDIGKIGVKDAILQKPEKLTNEEFNLMKAHAQNSVPYVIKIPIPTLTANILHHHEKWNGSGYPEKLSGESIPSGARIITLADSYDAMTSKRAYKKNTLSIEEALIEIRECSGEHFDPYVVKHFLKIPLHTLELVKHANYKDA